MTPTHFRKLALSMPGASEGEHHGHPDFRANGRVFASLHPDGERGMVRVPLEVQRTLVQRRPGVCIAANGAWGRAGCTYVVLAEATPAEVRDAMTSAWQNAMLVPPTRTPHAKKARRAAKKPTKRSPADR